MKNIIHNRTFHHLFKSGAKCGFGKEKLFERIDMLRMTPYYILAFYRDYLYGQGNGFSTEYFKNGKEGFEERAKRFFGFGEKYHVHEAGEAKKLEWHKKLFKMEE